MLEELAIPPDDIYAYLFYEKEELVRLIRELLPVQPDDQFAYLFYEQEVLAQLVRCTMPAVLDNPGTILPCDPPDKSITIHGTQPADTSEGGVNNVQPPTVQSSSPIAFSMVAPAQQVDKPVAGNKNPGWQSQIMKVAQNNRLRNQKHWRNTGMVAPRAEKPRKLPSAQGQTATNRMADYLQHAAIDPTPILVEGVAWGQ